MFCTEIVCEGCSAVIHEDCIVSKSEMTRIAREKGWSVGKIELCPECKKNRVKLKNAGRINCTLKR